MVEIDGGELLVRGLRAEGVEIIFAIADVSYTPVFRSAAAAGIRIVGGRHESAEVHMADGGPGNRRLWLASEESSYVNAEDIVVDGGSVRGVRRSNTWLGQLDRGKPIPG